MEQPKVRFLNVQPYEDKFLITDPYGVSEPLVITRELLFLMSLMDGSSTLEEIAERFTGETGITISKEQIEEILQTLDKNFLLMNSTFLSKVNSMKENMLRAGTRKPSHSGIAYPSEPQELISFLEESMESPEKESPIGILVPHMDMRVAIDTYGKVYGRINSKPELIILLGVSHYIHETPFSVCPLNMETPLGVIETDKKVVERLAGMFDHNIFHDILSYRQEHSIEFQTPFIKHIFPEAKIVPAIVSYGDESGLREIAKKIATAIEGQEVLVISSVDMSHVGRKFGDPKSYNPSGRDKEYIDLLSDMKNEEAFNLLKSDNNRTRIDGQFTNFVFLELMELLGARQGKLIDYQIYNEEQTDSKVSYAGMTFS